VPAVTDRLCPAFAPGGRLAWIVSVRLAAPDAPLLSVTVRVMVCVPPDRFDFEIDPRSDPSPVPVPRLPDDSMRPGGVCFINEGCHPLIEQVEHR